MCTYKRLLIAVVGIGLLGGPIGNSALGETLSDALKQIKELREAIEKQVSVPVGTIMPYGGPMNDVRRAELEKEGWLFCDGRKLDRGKYSDLYNAIYAAFGAPDGDSFNLPDLRGRFVRGVNYGAKEDNVLRDPDAGSRGASAKGGNDKNKVGSKQGDTIKKHEHTYVSPTRSAKVTNSGQMMYFKNHATADAQDHPTRGFTEGGDETRPKNIYVNWIIKAN